MNNPAPGASLNAVGTAPLHKLLSPPDVYSVLREVNVEGREVEFEGIERVDYAAPILISLNFLYDFRREEGENHVLQK